MSNPDGKSTLVFVSYSHQDEKWLERLQVYLKPWVRSGCIDLWDDTRIRSGAAWRTEIDQVLATARVAVLLVSAHFLASDFVQDEELPVLLEAAKTRGMRIFPVILGHCGYAESPLRRFQASNSPDRPLGGLSKTGWEKALTDLARDIAAEISADTSAMPSAAHPNAPLPTPTPKGAGGTNETTPSPSDIQQGTEGSAPAWIDKYAKLLVFVYGVVFVAAMILLAVGFPNPTAFQYFVFRVVLALAAAGVAALIPGLLDLKLGTRATNSLRAGGALAVFFVIYMQSPASLVTPPPRDSLHLSGVSAMDGQRHIIIFRPPKKEHVAKLSNSGSQPIFVSTVGFPDGNFYTGLRYNQFRIDPGVERPMDLVLKLEVPERTHFPFLLRGTDGSLLKVEIQLEEGWRAYLRERLDKVKEDIERLKSPHSTTTPQQIYLAARKHVDSDYDGAPKEALEVLTRQVLKALGEESAASVTLTSHGEQWDSPCYSPGNNTTRYYVFRAARYQENARLVALKAPTVASDYELVNYSPSGPPHPQYRHPSARVAFRFSYEIANAETGMIDTRDSMRDSLSLFLATNDSWGLNKGPCVDLSGASSLHVSVRGAAGGEEVQFKAFSTMGDYGDSSVENPLVSTWITLEQEWRTFEFPLHGERDLQRVVSPLVVVARRPVGIQSVTIFLADVYYEFASAMEE